MNEQIEGLWWKARIGYNNQNCDPEVVEKFAELIVQECIEHLESSVAVPNSEHSRVKWKCIRAIKEHFGVE